MGLCRASTILPIVSSVRALRGVTLLRPRRPHPIGLGDIGVGGGVRIGVRRHGLIGRCPRIGAVVEQFAKTERPSTGQLRHRYNHGRKGLLNLIGSALKPYDQDTAKCVFSEQQSQECLH
jgi:hypothetical protein